MPNDQWGHRAGPFVAIYSEERCIKGIMETLSCDYETATEDFCFNTLGAYAGPGTPTFVSSHPND